MDDQVEMADVLRILERDYPETFKICVQAVVIANLQAKVNELLQRLAPQDNSLPDLSNLSNVPSFVSE